LVTETGEGAATAATATAATAAAATPTTVCVGGCVDAGIGLDSEDKSKIFCSFRSGT